MLVCVDRKIYGYYHKKLTTFLPDDKIFYVWNQFQQVGLSKTRSNIEIDTLFIRAPSNFNPNT